MHYKHLLLATDLSKNSAPIAEKALNIAKDNNATLDILHVIEHSPIAYGGEFSIPIDANLEQSIEAQARSALRELAQKMAIPEDRQHIRNTSVKQATLEIAKEIDADLIVVGTHGHHGIDVLLGSRANAILHSAKCDVLAIRVKDNQ